MKSISARILCLILILAMLPGYFMSSAEPVSAAYENTYKNTGDQRSDIVGVALTQLGYREGKNNYTKYGVWYGSANMAWCGAFISWCANQAGIPTSIIRKNGFASLSGFGVTDTFRASSGRVPRPGDLFMHTDGSHVGIVYYVEGNYFYTLEGNASPGSTYNPCAVVTKKRLLTGNFIFGSPRYSTDAGHNYKKAYESAHPHREYMYCDHCQDFYYTGKTSTNSSCTTCIQASCTHTYGSWTTTGDSKHQRTCTKCKKVESKSHTWNSGTVTKKATCAETGTKLQTCTACNAQRTVTIEKTTTHSYGIWGYLDENSHYRDCTICGKQDSRSHEKPDGWETDMFYHWYLCSICDGKAGLQEHTFETGCEEPCEVCGYIRPTGHVIIQELSYDENGHWNACENCEQKVNYTAHNFDSQCDETCADCSFTRVTEHTFAEEWTSDASGHYHVCAVCGSSDDVFPHTPGPAATEEHNQECLECGFELEAKLEHVHNFEPLSSDADSHWGQCRCGEPYPRESHQWDVNTGKCRLCQLELASGVQTVEPEKFPWLLVLIPAIAVLTVICVILLVVIVKRSKKKKKVPVAV